MITVDDVKYESFADVQKITDPATKDIAVIEWGKFEHELNKKSKIPKTDAEIETEKKEEDDRLAKERTAKIEAYELDEDATDEQIEAKEQEIRDAETDEFNKRAEAVGLDENATVEEVDEAEKAESIARESDTKKSDKDKGESTAHESDTGKEAEQKREERAKVFAQHHNVPLETAVRIIESAEKIKEKHGGDSDELAIAAYSAQAQYKSLQNKLRKDKMLQSNPYQWKNDHLLLQNVDENGKVKVERVEKDQIVTNWREKNPTDAEGLDDDAVFKMAKRDNESWFKSEVSKTQGMISGAANKRKDTFIANLPEVDKEYAEDFKKHVSVLDPEDIMSDENTLLSVLNMIKGSKVNEIKEKHKKEIAAAEKRGFDRGKKNMKILGNDVSNASNKGGGSGNKGGKKKSPLTDTEKIQAKAKYGTFVGLSEDRMYELYEEELEATRKKKKS